MSALRKWFRKKLDEPCVCASGLKYRECCYHRECLYFVFGVASVLSVVGGVYLPGLEFGFVASIGGAVMTKFHYDRKRRKQS